MFDGGRTVDVAGNEQGTLALFLVESGELGALRGFTAALQTAHQYLCRRLRGNLKLGVLRAHNGTELLVDDLDDHLSGDETFQDLLAERTFAHAIHEGAYDLEVDVGLEKRELDLTHTDL